MRKMFERMFDSLRPHFEDGGKYAWAYPLFEGGETFVLTPGERTTGASTSSTAWT